MPIQEYVTPALYQAYRLDESTHFQLEEIDPAQLLHPKRLDIVAKFMYLDLLHALPHLAQDIYKEHLRAMTKGAFCEYDGSKSCFEDYTEAFENLQISMQTHGFLGNQLPIPISRDGILLDGAHRAACALFLNQQVKVVRIDTDATHDCYDTQFFLEQGCSQEFVEQLVLKYVQLKQEVRCVNIWPSAYEHQTHILDALKTSFQLIYSKELQLNEQGAFSYLSQIYEEYDWAQENGTGFSGVYRKLTPCFPNSKPVTIIFLQEYNQHEKLDNLVELKEKLRADIGLDKHSLHTTDSNDQTVQMAQLTLHMPTINFLNQGNPLAFKETFHQLQIARQIRDVVFTGSIVLALYGVRPAQDLDYFSMQDDPNSHNAYLPLYHLSKEDIFLDQRQTFTYFGMRFLTLENIVKFKKNRHEGKDADDIKLISLVLSKNNGASIQKDFLRWKRRTIAKVQGAIIRFAHWSGTYHLMRAVYKKIKHHR